MLSPAFLGLLRRFRGKNGVVEKPVLPDSRTPRRCELQLYGKPHPHPYPSGPLGVHAQSNPIPTHTLPLKGRVLCAALMKIVIQPTFLSWPDQVLPFKGRGLPRCACEEHDQTAFFELA